MERTNTGQTADPMLGRVLDGRYRVGSVIARGGMATVYEGLDLRLDRTVAIKVMRAEYGDDPDFVARFEREARSAARLSHHNVVAVFDQGEDHGTLFLVMEYVPGTTLRDLIREQGPLDPGRSLALIEPVLSALAAAHAAGMIHRDVKPENVLLAEDGRIKVADFGLARAVTAQTQHTATGGILIGTVSYLSPELVVDGKADPRSDVYAAGVLLYEMLTGQKPHQADTPLQVAYKHVHEDVPPPSALISGIPDYLDALVARATARDRDLRPTDARVFLHQVRRVRHALDHGAGEDPDLTADLMLPRRATAPLASEAEATEDDTTVLGAATAFAPEASPSLGADALAVAAAAAATGDHTEQIPLTPPAPPPAAPRAPSGPPDARPQTKYPAEKRSRRGFFLLLAVLALTLAAGIGSWYLAVARYTTTPPVINLSSSAAEAKLDKAGLRYAEGEPAYSETVARGSVISTSPRPGDRIRDGAAVTVVLSLGPERHDVPDMGDTTQAEAQSMLEKESLTLGGTRSAYSESIDAGKVITSDPKPGTPLKRGAAVTLVVSKGQKPLTIKDWTGKLLDRAEKLLEKLGFSVLVEKEFDDEAPAGTVIAQSPNAGTGYRGDEITLTASKGPEMIEIPKVKGDDVEDAQAELEGLGFAVEVTRNPLYVGAGVVVGSDPPAGEKAAKGSTITLSIV